MVGPLQVLRLVSSLRQRWYLSPVVTYMSNNIENIVNIVGVALVLGLVLRYASETTKLITASGDTIGKLYQTVSLQNVTQSQSPR